MFGYSREEIVGESIQLLVPEERSAEEEAVMSKVGAGQPVKRLETTRIRKDGRCSRHRLRTHRSATSTPRITGVLRDLP